MKKKNTRLFMLIGAVVLMLASAPLISCRPSSEPEPVTPIPVISPTFSPAPEPTSAPVKNEFPEFRGMVLAGNRLSFGLSTCGLVSYVGSNEGQAYCFDWENIVQLAGGDTFTAGLTKDGKLLISAAPEAFKADLSAWENIVGIAASKSTVYGLKNDGTVLSSDNSCSELNGIVRIDAGEAFLIALSNDGNLFAVGSAPDISAWKDEKIVSAAAGDSHIAALTADGRLLMSDGTNPFPDVTDIRSVLASGADTAVITEDGVLHTNCELIKTPVEHAVDFSSGYGHALVLSDDGTVLAFGDNEYLQCRVENWRLRPYADENGFIYGIAPGSDVKTGDAYTLENGTAGTAIILGDVNCDGFISTDDKIKMQEYIAGNTELSDVQKRAANIITDSKEPDAVDIADLEQIGYQLDGYITIDQYAKPFKYSGEVADAERLNSDTVGYIDLEHTVIQYPLMYGDDFYYHYHNPEKVATTRSSIYLYYSHPVKNIVITGHNLRPSGLGLHDLHKLQDNYAKDYSEFANRIWEVNVFGETHLWEVFAMYEEKPKKEADASWYYNINYPQTMDNMKDEEIAEWIEYQLERTELDYKLHITTQDQFMTVYTCADTHAESETGGRIYFFLRRADGH